MEVWFEFGVAADAGAAIEDDWMLCPEHHAEDWHRGLLTVRAGRPGQPLLRALFGGDTSVALKAAGTREGPRVLRYRTDGPPGGLVGRCRTVVQALGPVNAQVDWVRATGGWVLGAVTVPAAAGMDDAAWLHDLDRAKDGLAAQGVRIRRALDSAGRFVRRAAPALALSPIELDTLRRAFTMGYYDRPRRCTLDHLAAALGIVKSTVHHRLARVEHLAMRTLLDTTP